MPEIAEVALMSDAIRHIINGQKLSKIEILGGRYLGKAEQMGLTAIESKLPIQVDSVNVKGKFCWIELASKWYIAITFGMSGSIYYEPDMKTQTESKSDYMRHFHIRFTTESGSCFYFGDARRFGTVTISCDRDKLSRKLASLGPDMLTGPPITDAQFISIFRQSSYRQRNICVVLMGQKAISGVGNYIKSETLYRCGISPWAQVDDLDDTTLIRLHQSIRQIARHAYIGHGASLYTYVGTRREKGEFQLMLQVYGKTQDPEGRRVHVIPEGKSPDRRTTHYVPECQKMGSQRGPNQSPQPKIKLKLKLKLKLKRHDSTS